MGISYASRKNTQTTRLRHLIGMDITVPQKELRLPVIHRHLFFDTITRRFFVPAPVGAKPLDEYNADQVLAMLEHHTCTPSSQVIFGLDDSVMIISEVTEPWAKGPRGITEEIINKIQPTLMTLAPNVVHALERIHQIERLASYLHP